MSLLLNNWVSAMLFKTQLFQLNVLKINTIPEANAINQLIEKIVIDAIHSHNNLVEEEGMYIFYNRVPVEIQRDMLMDLFFLHAENEVRLLKYSLEKAVLDAVDAYRANYLTYPNVSRDSDLVLNIEGSLLNRTTIALSFDCMRGGWNSENVLSVTGM